MDIVGKRQRACHLTGSIVVAPFEIDTDAGALKNPHLGIEEQTGVHVAPVAIEDVTGDDKEIDPSADGQVDEIDQRLTGCTAQLSNRCTRVALEPVERTVDMQIGTVDEFHASSHPGDPTMMPWQ